MDNTSPDNTSPDNTSPDNTSPSGSPEKPATSVLGQRIGCKFIFVCLVLIGALWFYVREENSISEIDYSFFLEQLEEGNIKYIEFGEEYSTGSFKFPRANPGEIDNRTGLREKPPLDLQGEQVMLQERFRVRMPPNQTTQDELYQRLQVAAQEGELLLDNEPLRESNPVLIFVVGCIVGGTLVIFSVRQHLAKNR